MSKRIGEVLVEKGLITPVQLEKSIKAQLIFGGHLGTNLIELGFIEESTLGQTLAESFQVGYATFEMLHNIPQYVIQLVPDRLAERYRAIPLRAEDKLLHVAMVDPKNLAALDELSFVTRHKILPWVAPEIRVFQALEKYYDLPRRLRYISICQELDKKITAAKRDQRKAWTSGHAAEAEASPPARREPSAPDEPDVVELHARLGYGRHWQELVAEREEGAATAEAPAPAWERLEAPSGAAEAGEPQTLEGLADRFCAADDVGELADAVLAHVAHRGGRAILFKVQGETATLWDARGLDGLRDKASRFRLPLGSGSIFDLLLGQECYRGAVPDAPIYQLFYSMLGVDVPEEILLAPVHLNDRLVAILYADGGGGAGVRGETEDYQRMVRKLSLAMSLLIIKTRIHSV